ALDAQRHPLEGLDPAVLLDQVVGGVDGHGTSPWAPESARMALAEDNVSLADRERPGESRGPHAPAPSGRAPPPSPRTIARPASAGGAAGPPPPARPPQRGAAGGVGRPGAARGAPGAPAAPAPSPPAPLPGGRGGPRAGTPAARPSRNPPPACTSVCRGSAATP